MKLKPTYCLNCWSEVKGNKEGNYVCPDCGFCWFSYHLVYAENMYRRPNDLSIVRIPDGNLAVFKELPL